jgi:3',5'-cyclic AMP phosphodiesterase CpdA
MTDPAHVKTHVRLLHISDLHFGGDHGFWVDGKDPEPGGAEVDLAAVLLEDLNTQGESRIDALIVSGDLMTHARCLEHVDDALRFVNKMSNGLKLAKERIYIIPGNHDYEWYEANAQGAFARKTLTANQMASFTHEVHYRSFLKQFYTDDRVMAGEVFEIAAEKFRVKIGLLDSCKLVPSQFHEYGYLSHGQIKDLMKKMKVPALEPEIRVVVMHHHISSIVPVEPPKEKADVSVTLDAGRLIDCALDAGVGLVLHGHQHYPCITRMSKTRFANFQMQCFEADSGMYILSAGSAGVKATRRTPNIPNTYSIISLSPAESRVKIRAISPAGQDGSTVADTPIPLHVHV